MVNFFFYIAKLTIGHHNKTLNRQIGDIHRQTGNNPDDKGIMLVKIVGFKIINF